MRALAFFFLTILVPLAGCYQAGDLGEAPFRCSKNYPECPDKYLCGTDPSLNIAGKMGSPCQSDTNCVCVFPCNVVDDCPLSLTRCDATFKICRQ